MRRLGIALLALAVMSAVATAPARAAACGGRPAMTAGCCCKAKTPAPPRPPCCQVTPAPSDAALLSGLPAPAPAADWTALPVVGEAARAAEVPVAAVHVEDSPPGSPPVFLLDCTFRI